MYSSLLQKHFNQQCRSVSIDSSMSATSSSGPSTPLPTINWFEQPTIDLCVMNETHRTDVFELVTGTFFRDEPLNRCLAFDLSYEPHEFAELIIAHALTDRCSFVAIDIQTQKVIGVILNRIQQRSSSCKIDSIRFQSEKLRFVVNILKCLHEKIDLFDVLHVERVLHVSIIAIDAYYRGLRLTEKLIRASIERAQVEYQIQVAFAEATSLYSARAFRKQDFRVYEELIYTNYDHVRLASLIGEHDRCQLLAKKL
jgi:ribosomal protein S18 acetylase RimI-like enzyme